MAPCVCVCVSIVWILPFVGPGMRRGFRAYGRDILLDVASQAGRIGEGVSCCVLKGEGRGDLRFCEGGWRVERSGELGWCGVGLEQFMCSFMYISGSSFARLINQSINIHISTIQNPQPLPSPSITNGHPHHHPHPDIEHPSQPPSTKPAVTPIPKPRPKPPRPKTLGRLAPRGARTLLTKHDTGFPINFLPCFQHTILGLRMSAIGRTPFLV